MKLSIMSLSLQIQIALDGSSVNPELYKYLPSVFKSLQYMPYMNGSTIVDSEKSNEDLNDLVERIKLVAGGRSRFQKEGVYVNDMVIDIEVGWKIKIYQNNSCFLI